MQVWCNDRHVGDLNIAVHPGQSHVEIVDLSESALPSPFDWNAAAGEAFNPTFTKYAYKIEELRAGIEIDRFASKQLEDETARQIELVKRRYSVPADARQTTQENDYKDTRRYLWSWKGIRVDTDAHERLFDHPNFVPV